MITLESILPAGMHYRELWLPQNISGTNLPSSCKGGHALTLTNAAAKRTTCAGVHFDGSAQIKFADPYDAVNDWWWSFRLKLDQAHASGSSKAYLLGKKVDATNYLYVYLETDGTLVLDHREGNGAQTCASTQAIWTAGTWYHVLVSCSTGAGGQRVRIDGGTADAQTGNQTAISLVMDIVIGNDVDTGTAGFSGVIADSIMDDVALSAANELLLSKGIPVTTPLNIFTLDEGRGLTANDRGAGADDGTLDANCSWAYGAVRQSCLSFEGIDDHAVSLSGVDISGATTLVWVGKMKSTHVTLAANVTLMELYIDANDSLRFFADTSSNLSYYVEGNNTPKTLTIAAAHSIDDYMILLGTVNSSGAAALYRDGVSVDTDTAVGARSAAAATAYIGAINTPANYGVSKPILLALIDGAFSGVQSLKFSRDLDNWLGLGKSI